MNEVSTDNNLNSYLRTHMLVPDFARLADFVSSGNGLQDSLLAQWFMKSTAGDVWLSTRFQENVGQMWSRPVRGSFRQALRVLQCAPNEVKECIPAHPIV